MGRYFGVELGGGGEGRGAPGGRVETLSSSQNLLHAGRELFVGVHIWFYLGGGVKGGFGNGMKIQFSTWMGRVKRESFVFTSFGL